MGGGGGGVMTETERERGREGGSGVREYKEERRGEERRGEERRRKPNNVGLNRGACEIPRPLVTRAFWSLPELSVMMSPEPGLISLPEASSSFRLSSRFPSISNHLYLLWQYVSLISLQYCMTCSFSKKSPPALKSVQIYICM